MEESTPILDDPTAAHSLFSTITTLYILLLLYSPSILLRSLFSPILPITAALLLTLLRSGAAKRPNPARNEDRTYPIQLGEDDDNGFEESFVEWNVKAPLGVIYEADEESNQSSSELDPAGKARFAGCPSLSMCFPETDSDSGSSTDGDFPADWISDDDFSYGWARPDPNQEGLIEIAVGSYGAEKKGDGLEEEDNLIEIDIFTARSEEGVIAGKMGDPR